MGWGRKERVSPFSIKKFLSLSAKIFVGECFQCFITFGYRKMLDIRVAGGGWRRGDSRFSAEIVLSKNTETFLRRGIFLCCV